MSSEQNTSIFAQSAERLEQIARSLKPQSFGDNGQIFQTASSRLMAISPDEMWARQFSSQCIGPVCFKVAPGSDMTLPPLTQAIQSFAPARQAAAHTPMPAAVPSNGTVRAKPVPIGAVIGKPMRRGLFSRLFRPS